MICRIFYAHLTHKLIDIKIINIKIQIRFDRKLIISWLYYIKERWKCQKKYFASLGTLWAFERKYLNRKSLVLLRYEKCKFKTFKFLIIFLYSLLLKNIIFTPAKKCYIIKRNFCRINKPFSSILTDFFLPSGSIWVYENILIVEIGRASCRERV